MELIRFTDAGAFLDRTRAFFKADETQYGLAQSIAEQVQAGRKFGPRAPWFAVVKDERFLRSIALHTPPAPLRLVTVELEAFPLLIADLQACGDPLSGVVGHPDTAPLFAARWAHLTEHQSELAMHLRLHRLDHVTPPAGVSGPIDPSDLCPHHFGCRLAAAF